MFCVYILYSEKLNRFYIGTTDNAERRLAEHNNTAYTDSFTTRGIPWKMFLIIDNLHSKQAYDIERYLKRMKSSAYIKKLKTNPQIVEWIIEKHK